MSVSVLNLELLLIIASIVAIASRRLKIPYTIGLVGAGWVLASQSIAPNVHLTKELIYGVLLPPLIFEAAFHLEWKELKPDLVLISFLTTVGVVLSAGVEAYSFSTTFPVFS